MEAPLRLLIVEDSEDDAELIRREVRRAGFAVQSARVETAESLERALVDSDWDLIISDFALPSFSGLEALALAQRHRANLPFIIVSGAINEETAVAAMKAGAHDYVLKGNLARLAPAVTRELGEARLRRDRRSVEAELADLREQSASELRQSRDQLDVILRGVAEGIIARDAAGHVVYANEAAAKAFGYASAAEFLQASPDAARDAYEFWDEDGRVLPSEELPDARAAAGAATVEHVLRRRERATGDERWYIATATPIFDAERKAWMVISIFRNITDRKRAEAAALFLADASKALVSSLDFAATLATGARLAVPLLADWCAVEVVDDEAPHARSVALAHSDPSKDGLARELEHLVASGAAPSFGLGDPSASPQIHEHVTDQTLRAHLRDPGQLRPVLALGPKSAITVPLAGHGRPIGMMTFVRTNESHLHRPEDLALAVELARRVSLAIENARLYRQAREAIGARDEFLSIASHELRTPLTTLTLQLARLQKICTELDLRQLDDRFRAKLDQSVRQTSRLSSLIENLLDVSRVTTGRLSIQREEVDLTDLVQQVSERSVEDTLMAGCEVRITAPGPVVGSWDRLRIEQVLTNLLSNACKYAPGRPIDVDLGANGAFAWFSVRDRGIGIAPRDVERIFGRFERAVSARHYGGLGLGLFIVRQIVEAHGGEIRAESKPGKGSTFTIVLPRSPDAALRTPPESDAPAAPA